MISNHMERKEYDKAQELINSISKQSVDKRQLQADLFINQGKNYESLELLEQILIGKVNE